MKLQKLKRNHNTRHKTSWNTPKPPVQTKPNTIYFADHLAPDFEAFQPTKLNELQWWASGGIEVQILAAVGL